MMFHRKHLLIGSAFLLAVIALIGWAYNYFDDQRSAATDAMHEALTCAQLGSEIGRLRHSPAGANQPATRPSAADLNGRIAAAAANTGLSARAIDRIDHDPPHQSVDGHSVETPTRIALRQTTLPQLAALLQEIDRPNDGLRVSRLHLAAPPGAEDAKTWSAEVTLTDSAPVPPSRSGPSDAAQEAGPR
jgi:hypothetical protein